MGTAGVWVVIGVIVLVLLAFVGLVWLFVRLSGPPQMREQPSELQPPVRRVTNRQVEGKQARRPRR